ncbi:S-formylglutathione hydrolase [Condylostylus longicornis]|uniref:S-formylglutathione hydrolase n=1 Tax=Condylostylus longicornis TaxID=2530218 RepID=UPI00244E27DE|nr:S-formylglutathione hydrolase [Condylostylus longicornis]
MPSLTLVSSNKCFAGDQNVYSHQSSTLNCSMKFSIYIPPNADIENKVPVLYWLSGLTCTEENFVIKAGAQRYAAENGIAIVCPDTSPRNVNIPGEDDSYDFGSGAGFYVDATQEPWSKHYKMNSYVTSELINLISDNFPMLSNKKSICGHSMGGHGALICALKNPGLYCSVSAFAPISNPINCPWGQKAFKGYLGENQNDWKEFDATSLVANYSGVPIEIFIDQGIDDKFYKEKQLLPENLVESSAKNNNVQVVLKMRDGYDHSYFYIASFIGEHIEYHVKHLK